MSIHEHIFIFLFVYFLCVIEASGGAEQSLQQ